ncbi:MAG: phasin family protein [Actinomycetota bacterium]
MIKTEQFAAANKAAIDSLLTIANASLANAERLAALNLNTARELIADATNSFGALLAVKDVQELVAVQRAIAKPAIAKSVAYSRSVYEIFSESAQGISQIVEGHTADLKQNVSSAIEQSLKHAPAGSEAIVAAVKSALTHADTAFETLSQSAKQAKATIETTVASANAAANKLMAQAA